MAGNDCIMDVMTLRKTTLAFVARHESGDTGRYRYSTAVHETTLYSSTYAAMTRSLYHDVDSISDAGRAEWITYLNEHQDDDGLFRDPVIFNQSGYRDDPLWCGRPHLSCHVVTALNCLGGIAPKPIAWLDSFCETDSLLQWLSDRDWGARIAWTGNEIMNVGQLLQYARDFQNDDRAGRAIEVLREWMELHHFNRGTGLWGQLDMTDPVARSHAVQAAYHFWPLWTYDRQDVPGLERAIDSLLQTQNKLGGFGWGVHNAAEPLHSSACEDIDSIEPLCRFGAMTDYRKDDVQTALTQAVDWILRNRMADGGFVFILDVDYEYGHDQLRGERGVGAMFSTWFRSLTLAYLGMALSGIWLGQYRWNVSGGPGYQFWWKE